MCKFQDLTGNKYGKLTVISRAANIRGRTAFRCLCECGGECIVTSDSLKQGKTKSCGCIRKTGNRKSHGMSHSKIYNSWRAMHERCRLKTHKEYKNYGGRGIKVCEEWRSFEPFYQWSLKNGYSEGLTIDRIDVDGNYEPQNCRWITIQQQQKNKQKKRGKCFVQT